jgi:ornithine cyclodeaminase
MVTILNTSEIAKALPMKTAIECMKKAFLAFAEGKVTMPQRMVENIQDKGTLLIMPSYSSEGKTFTVKALSIFNNNAELGLPPIQGALLVFNKNNGSLEGILEAGSLTAIRTGAVCGLATDLLARKDSKVLTVFGSGAQAKAQLEAVCDVRQIQTIKFFSPNKVKLQKFINEAKQKFTNVQNFLLAASPDEAIESTDIICTATNSAKPVFNGLKLKPGTHINAIGSYKPHVQELDEETIKRSLIIVDSREDALAETGDLIIPIQKGVINSKHIHCELGELLLGSHIGRQNEQQITLFKSVGLAIQDNYAAEHALKEAKLQKIGNEVSITF